MFCSRQIETRARETDGTGASRKAEEGQDRYGGLWTDGGSQRSAQLAERPEGEMRRGGVCGGRYFGDPRGTRGAAHRLVEAIRVPRVEVS